jgi:hypothetical protein
MMLMHLLRRPEILKSAAADVERTKLFAGYKDLELIWNIAYLYFLDYKGCIPKEVLIVDIDIRKDEAGVGYMGLENLVKAVDHWYATTDFFEDHIKPRMLEMFREYDLYYLREDLDTKTPAEIAQGLEDTSRRFNQNPFQRPTIHKPFENIRESLNMSEIMPMGVPFLDTPLGGGLRYGESLGVLGPSGGGKTVLALQIADGHVRNRKHIAYCQVEQPLDGDIMTRICSLATGKPTGEFEKGYDMIKPEIRRTLEAAMPLWDEYFHFIDLSNLEYELSSIDALLAPFEELRSQGIHCDALLLDWWGEIRDRLNEYAASHNSTESRRKGRFWLTELKIKMSKIRTRLIVMHQLSGEAAGKGPNYKPKSQDAQEDKNMNNRFDFFLTFGNKDSDNMVRFFLDKARRTANWETACKLDGNHCRFISDNPDEGPADLADMAQMVDEPKIKPINMDSFGFGQEHDD